MMTKRNVLFLGIIGSVLSLVPVIINQISSCYQKNWFFCRDSYEIIAVSLLPLLPLFLLSLITYRMRDDVFRAWWGFARWWVLVIVAATFFLENAGGGGGIGISGAVSSGFSILILGILYAIFIIVSLIQITRAYLRTK